MTSCVDKHVENDDDAPYTPEQLMNIISVGTGLTMLPSRPFDEVYPNLYLGEESIAKSRSGLKNLGVTHILNASQGKDDGYHVHTNHVMYRPVNIEYLGIEATDISSFNLSKYFDKCNDFIDNALQNGGKVMVHCKVGASRSATIALAFLMMRRHFRLPDAIRSVRREREICPNDGFLQQLCDLYEKLRKSGHYQKAKQAEVST